MASDKYSSKYWIYLKGLVSQDTTTIDKVAENLKISREDAVELWIFCNFYSMSYGKPKKIAEG